MLISINRTIMKSAMLDSPKILNDQRREVRPACNAVVF